MAVLLLRDPGHSHTVWFEVGKPGMTGTPLPPNPCQCDTQQAPKVPSTFCLKSELPKVSSPF